MIVEEKRRVFKMMGMMQVSKAEKELMERLQRTDMDKFRKLLMFLMTKEMFRKEKDDFKL